ncbi:MAG: ribonuclease J [Absicoccus porci]|uniref:ribonuclease J n=1 Tax=Absicoccus porci TaxID=2486576 RepID=UPI00235326D1|nr:ribonuclease J [Absicoccus porci]MCI6088364.1 ribonuclease J [Absicoccus porci]MDD7329424.1 ribonuclease J [Absicoccus porci]MDY4738993.1 ribonuclease J [Absicoccus porci]
MPTHKPNAKKETIRIFMLGGQDEDGKNMMCIEIDGDIYVIEAGIKFPDPKESLGIEYVIQDISYLIEHKDRVVGVFITHGHDDVVSALPYLLAEVPSHVYTCPLAARQIQKKNRQMKVKGAHIHTVKRHDIRKIGGRKVVFFPITHAYPGAFGVAILTNQGYIVYSGEFIEDYDDLSDNYRGSLSALSKLGTEGVFVLLQESKGADRPGHTSPNHRLAPYFSQILEQNDHRRVFVSVYLQSIYRMQEVIKTCIKYHRKMLFFTEEQQEMMENLKAIGYEVPEELIIDKKHFNNDLKDIVVIIAQQGPILFRTINNIINNEVKPFEFHEDDILCIASPIVPGAERVFSSMENDLYKEGGEMEILTSHTVSMHPSIEDLKMMLFLLRPKYYIPVKGQYRLLYANAQLAMDMGYNPNNILILDNGQVAQFENGRLVSCRMEMELQETPIDGNKDWDMAGVVLKDREILSTDGVIILAVGIDAKTKKIINGPDVQTRGLIYLRDAEYITKDVAKIMEDTITADVEKKKYDNMETRGHIRDKVTKYLLKQTKKRPMILPVIMEINSKK